MRRLSHQRHSVSCLLQRLGKSFIAAAAAGLPGGRAAKAATTATATPYLSAATGPATAAELTAIASAACDLLWIPGHR